MKGIIPGGSTTSIISGVSNSNLTYFNNLNHTQSRNNLINHHLSNLADPIINNRDSSSLTKANKTVNMTKTYTELQHNKSNSLSFNINHNFENKNLSGMNVILKKENSDNPGNIGLGKSYLMNSNLNYLYKKVQPKIINKYNGGIKCNFRI